jgi:hypothetical protein
MSTRLQRHEKGCFTVPILNNGTRSERTASSSGHFTLCTHYTGSGWDPETVWTLWKAEVSCQCRKTILGSQVITSVVVIIPTQLSQSRKERFKKAGWMDKGKKGSLNMPSNKYDCPLGCEKCRMTDRYAEDRFSHNVGICLRNFTASHCRRR